MPAVFTQPDKPVGRHAVLTPPPVKQLAQERGIPVYQPTKMRDGTVAAQLKELAPDCLVVRPEKVTIEAYDRHGKPFTLEAEGFMARAICHENDHLDGHIFKDITHHMLTDEELRELDEE